MFMRDSTQRLMAAILAAVVLVATAPVVVAARAMPIPCDCPSMHMAGMDHHAAPARQKAMPCNETQKCVCDVTCGMAANLSRQSFPLPSIAPMQKVTWSAFEDGPSLSVKPAIPPPII
jgi:hypothetical protein